MKQYWHRFPGRPDNIVVGKSRCEICNEIATSDNIGKPIREGWAGFEKHAVLTPAAPDSEG